MSYLVVAVLLKGDSLPHGPRVAGVPARQALDPDLHPSSCPEIAQVVEPACEYLGLAELGQDSL